MEVGGRRVHILAAGRLGCLWGREEPGCCVLGRGRQWGTLQDSGWVLKVRDC